LTIGRGSGSGTGFAAAAAWTAEDWAVPAAGGTTGGAATLTPVVAVTSGSFAAFF
jgi:hypothetical protein